MNTSPYCKPQFNLSEDTHYFCGHSLGAQPKSAKEALMQSVAEWENHRVSGWTKAQWLELPKLCGDRIAPLIGAHTDEVIVSDNTTLNLMKLLFSAIASKNNRKIILTEEGNFPTDLYIAQSVAKLHNMTLKVVPRDAIMDSLDDAVAVVLLTHVNYRTSQKWDMKTLNQKAQHHDIKTLWDLSHSVGVTKLSCTNLGVDFAVGCTYKYLNGGPGAPSFLYVNKKHQHLHPAIQGWMGHEAPFDFAPEYQSAQGIKRYLSGTPSILSMKALYGALCVFEKIDLAVVERESNQLTQYFIEQCAIHIPALQCLSPFDASQRGSHVAFRHPQADKLAKSLIERGIVIDYRTPDLIRFGIAPLYINSHDIDVAINHLKALLYSP